METWIVILLLIPTLICVLAAIYLCAAEKEGWGWFLFVAFLIAMAQKQMIQWAISGGQ